jgi:hypothetical protein
MYINIQYVFTTHFDIIAGILEQSMGARNRVGIGLSYRPPGYIGWNSLESILGSLKVKKFELRNTVRIVKE